MDREYSDALVVWGVKGFLLYPGLLSAFEYGFVSLLVVLSDAFLSLRAAFCT